MLSLYLHISSLNLCLLFSTVDVILIDLDCLPILFIACVHFSRTLFVIKLELIILFLGV